MWQRSLKMLVYPLVGLLSTAGLAASWSSYTLRRGPETASLLEVSGRLRGLMQRERRYYAANHAYTTRLEELQPNLEPVGEWRFRAVAFTLDDHVRVLLEADDGAQTLCLDREGHLQRSVRRPLPSIPPWLPAEVPHASLP